jgi:hypothetical protein
MDVTASCPSPKCDFVTPRRSGHAAFPGAAATNFRGQPRRKEKSRQTEKLHDNHGSKNPFLSSPPHDWKSGNRFSMNFLPPSERPRIDLPTTAIITTKTGGGHPAWEDPVSFPEWHEILAVEPLDALTRERFGKAIISYLRYCRDAHERASIAGAKRYLEAGAQRGPLHRDALRWFFVAYRRRHEGDQRTQLRPVVVQPPTPMPIPPGTPQWEADLIRKIRLRGFLWNTEQIYRSWMNRFAAKIAPVTPDQADAKEVQEYLTALAVQQVAANTQRQALNALVFYFREVVGRDLGDLGEDQRARRGPRIPVVLSRAEIDRLFAQLQGTWLLMAQLQYGRVEGVGSNAALNLCITFMYSIPRWIMECTSATALTFGGGWRNTAWACPWRRDIEDPGVWFTTRLTSNLKMLWAGNTF